MFRERLQSKAADERPWRLDYQLPRLEVKEEFQFLSAAIALCSRHQPFAYRYIIYIHVYGNSPLPTAIAHLRLAIALGPCKSPRPTAIALGPPQYRSPLRTAMAPWAHGNSLLPTATTLGLVPWAKGYSRGLLPCAKGYRYRDRYCKWSGDSAAARS